MSPEPGNSQPKLKICTVKEFKSAETVNYRNNAGQVRKVLPNRRQILTVPKNPSKIRAKKEILAKSKQKKNTRSSLNIQAFRIKYW